MLHKRDVVDRIKSVLFTCLLQLRINNRVVFLTPSPRPLYLVRHNSFIVLIILEWN